MSCGEEMFRADSPGRLFVCGLDAGHPWPHKDRSGEAWKGMALTFVALLLAACQQCNQVPAPATANTIYLELTEGGCLAQGADSQRAVADELSRVDRPDWIVCMSDGGSVTACGAPCQ